MKKRFILSAVLICLAVLGLMWLRQPPRPGPLASEPGFSNNATAAETNLIHPEALHRPESTNDAQLRERLVKRRGRDNWNSRSNDFYEAEANSNFPLDFYGKVVDEASNAVVGATVNFTWNRDDVSNLAHGGENRFATQSDSMGLFKLQGEIGRFLDVRVLKRGYYTPRPGIWSFKYSADTRFFPENPVVFTLRKKGTGEPLIQRDWPVAMEPSPQLRGDGTPVEIDLLNGQIVPEGKGQLKLTLHRSGAENGQANYDWTCGLTIPGGGLAQTVDEFAFEAPTDGYLPAILINMSATNEQWQGEIRNSYYIRLPNGEFGRIDFRLLIYNGVFHLHSAINPSGSRNLEPENSSQD